MSKVYEQEFLNEEIKMVSKYMKRYLVLLRMEKCELRVFNLEK